MLARKLLIALSGAFLVVSLVLAQGCDIFNPELLPSVGVNPGPAAANVKGYVLLAVNNMTDDGIVLSYELDVSKPGQSSLIMDSRSLLLGSSGYAAVSMPCDAVEMRLTSLTYGGSDTVEDPDADPQAPAAGNVVLPTDVFTAPLLDCGSVVFVTVTGSGNNVIADVQILN